MTGSYSSSGAARATTKCHYTLLAAQAASTGLQPRTQTRFPKIHGSRRVVKLYRDTRDRAGGCSADDLHNFDEDHFKWNFLYHCTFVFKLIKVTLTWRIVCPRSTHPPALLSFGQLAAVFAHAGDLD